MAVALVICVLLASASVGHGNNFTALYNEFFSPCTADQIFKLLFGNFDNKCTQLASERIGGVAGTGEDYYYQVLTRPVVPAGDTLRIIRCAKVHVDFYDGYRIHTFSYIRTDPITKAVTTVVRRSIHFEPILRNRNQTVIVRAGACGAENLAHFVGDGPIAADVACEPLVNTSDYFYAQVATEDRIVNGTDIDFYVNLINQKTGVAFPDFRIPQDPCP